jgi:endoglucanase
MSRLVMAVAAVGACNGSCSEPASADSMQPQIEQVTSSEIRLRWPRVREASEVRIFIAPEPPEEANGPLPAAKRVASLDGDAHQYRIRRLAAGVDVFIRIEADTPSGTSASNLHAKTAGGPRAELDSPIREVHGFAPDVLRVVVEGEPEEGEDLASGEWKVKRRDGTEPGVESVHRHSVPVRQPEYEIGWGGEQDPTEIVVAHRIYLELGEELGTRDVLEIEGPDDIRFMLPYSDRYLPTPVVQLNQVGYNPRADARWAYVSGWMGDGGGLSLGNFPDEAEVLRVPSDPMQRREATASAPLEARADRDSDAGTAVRQIDLSGVSASDSAVYRVRIPGVGVSWPTQVSEAAAFKAFYVSARGLLHNRWGVELDSEATDWTRPADHTEVFTGDQKDAFSFYPEDTPKRGKRSLRGGYHDAGDFDQRPTHTVVAQLLMRAFELKPDRYKDGQLTLPESGNGVPDLLDEALWGVKGWAELQQDSGAVRAGVESHRHPWGIYPAHEDPLPYWTYAPDAKVTARAAGLFAQASRLLAPYDEPRAEELQGRAERAWQWAKNQGVSNEFKLYALGELYRLTGNSSYKNQFEQAWDAIGRYGAFSNFAKTHLRMADYKGSGRVMPDYILGYVGADGASEEIVSTTRDWLTRQADGVAESILQSEHAHRNARGGGSTDWGEATVMGRHLDPIIARLQLGELQENKRQQYVDALSVAADYVLGANPLGMVFMTGLGSRRPNRPLHLDSLVFVHQGQRPMPGIPVYGPVGGLPGSSYYQHGGEAFHPRFNEHPPMRRYADIRTFVKTNECTVWECQAPHAEHFAVLANDRTPPSGWAPGRGDGPPPSPQP